MLVILSGVAGAGKDTIKQEIPKLRNERKNQYCLLCVQNA